MRTIKTVMMVMIACGLLVTTSYGADVAKIGLIDFQRILNVSNAGKTARAQLNQKGEKLNKQLQAEGKALEELQSKLQREALVMDKNTRDEKEREVRIKINDFKSLQVKFKRQMQENEAKLIGKIQQDLDKVIGDIGKKEGYLLVLDKKAAGVIYAPDTIDLTDRVIKAYDSYYAVKMGKTN